MRGWIVAGGKTLPQRTQRKTEDAETNYPAVPIKTMGPVGWGTPPAGSTVTAKALAATPAGNGGSRMAPAPCASGSNTPALMGLPSAGMSQSW